MSGTAPNDITANAKARGHPAVGPSWGHPAWLTHGGVRGALDAPPKAIVLLRLFAQPCDAAIPYFASCSLPSRPSSSRPRSCRGQVRVCTSSSRFLAPLMAFALRSHTLRRTPAGP